MRLYRCFAWNDRARPAEPDGPLWVPRPLQGDGRHDNPDRFGCLYLSERAVSPVVEQLAADTMLIDLDDAKALLRERLRPSHVATRQRTMTQPQARTLHERHPTAAGLRWWSVFEALWPNVTLFDRALPRLRIDAVRPLAIDQAVVIDAAEFLGIRRV